MDLSKQYYNQTDAKQFETEALLTNSVLLAALALYSLNVLPLFALVLIVSVCITRWMICIHELFHITKGKKLRPFVRLLLIPFTPLNIGYDEYQSTHMGHHRYNAGHEDPEAYHIRKSHIISLLISMTYPEQSFFRYLKHKDLSLEQWYHVSIRLFFFLALLSLFQQGFVVFWLILRTFYGLNIWVFFHALHTKNGDYGTFAVSLPSVIKKIYLFLYGKHTLEATLHHNVHHQWPRMAYWHLEKNQAMIAAPTSNPIASNS